MRKKIVVGNWKMNTTPAEAVDLASRIVEKLQDVDVSCDVGVAPPFVSLAAVKQVLGNSGIMLAAQNCHFEDDGAFTGEISVRMLEASGCSCVLAGHSERRQYFGETNEVINRKVKKALGCGMSVILCVGETLEEREEGVTEAVVTSQVTEGLEGVESIEQLVIAYEPVWAIGTGRTATSGQAQEVHASIRATIAKLYGQQAATALRIQYGGSVKPSNAAELFAMPDIDGGLIGGASLKAEDFMAIVEAAC
ncbi:triose-phosphate isomerase [Prosthecochloris sp. HL-130-GSB]|jgi:triosephosphate isomerase (TIM)|uniref:Triosephosphate isomerase n=1 Tax=Prosthecochloris aestuarii TaxID=1102 RepID=A0A831SRK5_PROAE|nr:triose-phosphate isomerase [Prosthecochloris sp. HL-130-GSB]ARM30628.1 triose-phosphate isomerase [Prosthecochloris sp. HL-130-GSB]MBO8093210.1 triose-phosphate isomerase [Prosthecochloris sp.]HED31005.1 triose-phosphate isomerase [Prosthecochloris aestuarii]